MLASFVGSAPEAAVYALAGAVARESARPVAVWAAVCIVATCSWLIGRGVDRRLIARPGDGAPEAAAHRSVPNVTNCPQVSLTPFTMLEGDAPLGGRDGRAIRWTANRACLPS